MIEFDGGQHYSEIGKGKDQLRDNFLSKVRVNPVVALNAAFVIIKPLPIQEWTLTQCHLLDYTNGDFKKVSSLASLCEAGQAIGIKSALYKDNRVIRPDLYATIG